MKVRSGTPQQLLGCFLALGSLAAGLALAWHHPLSPVAALGLLCLGCIGAAWRTGTWLFFVPACLPFLNFSPWTGWIVFDEFDILLLGTLAGAYGRWAWSQRGDVTAARHFSRWLLTFVGAGSLLGLYRGFADAGGFTFDWFAGYTDALNSLRVFKSLGFALLFVPLLRQTLVQSAARAGRRLASGSVLGLAGVTLAILWERAVYPGLTDFSAPYRTVALFWEMHVGGAAIDAYLVLTVPFAAWAVLRSRRTWHWAGAAALALATGYACLTSFSRGVYLAVALPMLFLLLWLSLRAKKFAGSALRRVDAAWQRLNRMGWRGKADAALALALLAEVAVVLGAGSFMTQRLASADRDWGSRQAHWQQGLDLLTHSNDKWWGIGLGRLPANYARRTPQDEFSGEVHRREEPGARVPTFVTVQGPATRDELGGLYGLTQQVRDLSGMHNVSLQIRVQKEAVIQLELCERHLLYDGDCHETYIRVSPGDGGWHAWQVRLKGPPLRTGSWNTPLFGVFSLSVLNAGAAADFSQIRLTRVGNASMLENGDFSAGMAHWLPNAQSYFLPWHIDNLWLELLIERGLTGLLLFAALVAYAQWQLLAGRARSQPLSPYLAASLCGAALLGLVSSIMDVPRVAFLLYLYALFALES
jgi:O-antigen ligase